MIRRPPRSTLQNVHSFPTRRSSDLEAQLAQYNYILTVGDKEEENKSANLRTRDNVVHGEISIEQFIQTIDLERKERNQQSPYTQKKEE